MNEKQQYTVHTKKNKVRELLMLFYLGLMEFYKKNYRELIPESTQESGHNCSCIFNETGVIPLTRTFDF